MGERKKSEEGKETEIAEHLGPHHIQPMSRGGSDLEENKYPSERWPSESGKHAYWHVLFSNLTPEEAILKIAEHIAKNGAVDNEFFKVNFIIKKEGGGGARKSIIHETKNNGKVDRRDAWQVVFGAMDGKQAIEWIQAEFIKKEWLNK